MNANVAIITKISDKLNSSPQSFAREYENRIAQENSSALEYLREKFPDIDEKVFFTDYTGKISDRIVASSAVCKWAKFDVICKACLNPECKLPPSLKAETLKPCVKICENPKGFKFLDVRWTIGENCKFDPLRGKFGEFFRKSGLTESHLKMTFENYECSKTSQEIRRAKIEAVMAFNKNSSLVLAGKPGTGKTHLAVAIAIESMRHGRQALFRHVKPMIDEIRQSIEDHNDYYGLMKIFQEVPCLVLDDFGKENATKAGMAYLHQIIDYRYEHNLQTIVTTNARDSEELSRLSAAEFIVPIVQRLNERGNWITILNAENFRTKKHEVNFNGR